MSELRFTPEMYDEGIRLATEDLRKQISRLQSDLSIRTAQRDGLRRQLAEKDAALGIATRLLRQLKQYSACEGRPDGDKLLNGLCRAETGIIVACADPKYEMYEAYEAVENWLKDYVDEALAAIRSGKEQGK